METHLSVELIAVTPTDVIERAGRLAWDSEPGNQDRFIKMLIAKGHTSVLEHASATFLVTGISRACSHQLVRHRIASYTQRSQRYVDEGESDYIMPASIHEDLTARIAYVQGIRYALALYKKLRAYGVPKEDARFVLPNAIETRIVITMNFRELRHFFTLRCAKDAQWEIRAMAMEMLQLSYLEASSVFDDLHRQLYEREDL